MALSGGSHLERPASNSEQQHVTAKREQWWKIHLFRGIVKDIRRRAPFYGSDWRDAWDYRVVPATVYMYFAKSVLLSCMLEEARKFLSLCHRILIYP